jgi:hypothetical protein
MIIDRTIRIEIRNTYGKDRFYPGCIKAEKLLSLTGKKTFSEKDLLTIVELGFIITKKEQYADLFKG